MASKLYFYYGAMGSSKTLRLLTTAYNFQEKNIHFICLKPKIDDRDGVGIIHSRVGIERECTPVNAEDDLFKMILDIKSKDDKLQKVMVDECQFLTEEQVEQLAQAVDTLDIDVMCYGLRTDFKSKMFQGSKRLFELSDTIEEVKSHCSCGRKAMMNARFDEHDNLILDGKQIEIGGNERYKPLCRKCYTDELNKTVKKLTQHEINILHITEDETSD